MLSRILAGCKLLLVVIGTIDLINAIGIGVRTKRAAHDYMFVTRTPAARQLYWQREIEYLLRFVGSGRGDRGGRELPFGGHARRPQRRPRGGERAAVDMVGQAG